MLRRSALLLALVAALLGFLPADNCWLTLAGQCCEHSHVFQAGCPLHDEHGDGDDDDHEHTLPAGGHTHHTTCVVASPDRLTAQEQQVVRVDAWTDYTPTFGLASLNEVRSTSQKVQHCSHDLKPPDTPLFLLAHAFLI